MKKDKSIARNVALLKVQCTDTFQFCTIESSQMYVYFCVLYGFFSYDLFMIYIDLVVDHM